MRWNLQHWIEDVKHKPEYMRRRYVFGCVFTGMFFVLIVWSLNVSESLKSTQTTIEAADSRGFLPKASDFSLDEILSGKEMLTAPEAEKTGSQFIQEEVENRTRPNFEEGGVQPKVTDPESVSGDMSGAAISEP